MIHNQLHRSWLSLVLVLPLMACGPHPDADASGTGPSTQRSDQDEPQNTAEVPRLEEVVTIAETAPEDSVSGGDANRSSVSAEEQARQNTSAARSAADDGVAEQKQESVAENATDASSYQPLGDIREIQTGRKPLDLSLPQMDWDADENRDFSNGNQSLPDVFLYRKPENGMNLSGKLHWDEDEEATHMSLEESIKGAEVELQFRLP